ncbi:MAG: hypothetical protein EBS30_03835 [Planctomycetes bacterium]|nr:hypothetical protein [Planctomycetota bacterium]
MPSQNNNSGNSGKFYTCWELIVHYLFSRFFNVNSESRKAIRRTLLRCESLEARDVPAATLMTQGGLAGAATFGIIPTSPFGSNLAGYFTPYSMVSKDINGGIIDFNKDGFADIVQTGSTTEQVGYSSTSPVLVGNNRNGFIKVALGSPSGISFLTTGSTNNGAKVANEGIAEQIAVVDLNGDGYQDILGISRASNTSDFGSVTKRFIYDPVANKFGASQLGDPLATNLPSLLGNAAQMTLGDVNVDGIPDLVFPRYDANNPLPNPNPSIAAIQVIPLVGFDIYLGKQETSGTWIGNFQATPYASVNLQSASADLGMALESGALADYQVSRCPYVAAILTDLNNDGKLDLAVPENNGISVFANPGNGQFSGSGVFIQSAGVNANGLNLTAGDFNNDGKMDLATTPNIPDRQLWDKSTRFANYLANIAPISLYTNSSTGGTLSFSMSAVSAFNANSGWNGPIQAGDFNGDGNIDIAVTNATNDSQNYGIVEGDGKGSFGTLKIYQGYANSADNYASFNRTILAIGATDVDNNGQIDIVSAAYNIGVSLHPSDSNNDAAGVSGVSFNFTFANPAFNPSTILTATQGVPYNLQLPITGGDASKPYVYAVNTNSIPLPAGLTLSSSGQLSGTPTQPGPFQLEILVTQPNGPRSVAPLYLTVNPSQQGQLIISPSTLPNVSPNQVVSQQLTAAGGVGTIRFAVSSGILPSGLSISGTGLISGIVTATGSFTFTVSATDANGSTGFRQYTVVSTAVPLVPPLKTPFIVTGPGSGGRLNIFNADGTPRSSFLPYGAGYKGGITVARGDVNGDRVLDLITGTTAGSSPNVRVFDGRSLALIRSFFAYDQGFMGGVNVATGDVNGDGKADIVTGAGPGAQPAVKVFSGANNAVLRSFLAFDGSFRGGITVASGDTNGDRKADIIVGAGPGGPPHVKVFSGANNAVLRSFYAYLPQFTGGITVASGDVNGDGKADIITGAGPGADPHVNVFSGATGANIKSFDAFPTTFRGGISVAAADLNGDGKADIVVGALTQSSQLKAFNAVNLSVIDNFFAYSEALGLRVAAG